MPLDEPRWWYGDVPSMLAQALRPVGGVVGRIAERRWQIARPYRSPMAVICIGNFTAGGTGKTPLVIEVARLLNAMGHAPTVLTRGYGGTVRGTHRVDVDSDRADRVGDEALLLARVAPTYVDRDRARGARAIEAAVAAGGLQASVIVMDDGLQNPSLVKNLTIAVVDGGRGVGNGLVIPAGPLRAELKAQCRRVDAIVVNGPRSAAVDGLIARDIAPVFAGPILQVAVTVTGDVAWLRQRPLVAFAGIGNPQRFFQLLRAHGGTLAEAIVFADHKALRPADAVRILEVAQRHHAAIVTTAKDMARLAGVSGALQELRVTAQALPIHLAFADGDEARLEGLLNAASVRP